MIKRKGTSFIMISIFVSLVSLTGVFAIDLNVEAFPVSNSFIVDLNEPATFDLVIENLGDSNSFEVFTSIGIDILPNTTFYIDSGTSKKIRIFAIPQKALQSKKGFFTFQYLIRNSVSEIQRETLTINIIDLDSVFRIIPGNMNPNSEVVIVSIKNTISRDFDNINIKMTSAFFDYEEKLSLNGFEIKEIEIPVNIEKIKGLAAGSYLVNSVIEVDGKSANKEAILKFLEQEDIDFDEFFSGLIKREQTVVRHNVGNVEKEIIITVERDLISSLFVNFNIAPSYSSFEGFKRVYVWEREIVPNEELKIVIVTNWFYPIFIILLIGGLIFLRRKYIANDLILKKKVSFVRTKGGQFALKIMLRVKSKKFVERISIVDKLPPLVELYNKFGAVSPDEIDLKNRRLKWEIESLNEGEERIFSYIIYSKIGVVGRFELPSARAIYEREGKIKEVDSNRSFFINEGKE